MVKDKTTNKEKKTMWSRFTSWLATTWLGKALSTVKGWFSSSGATQAGGGQPEANISTKDGKAPDGKVLSHEQSLGNSEVPAPVTPAAEEPAEPTPSNGTSATSLSGSAGPDNDEKSFDMKETNQNPVQSNSTPVGGMGATPQQGFKALIKIDDENLKFMSMTADTTDYIRGCKNPANGKECLVYVKHGEDMYRIIFTGDGKINSVAKQHKSTKHMNGNAINPNDNMESVKTLFSLNEAAPRVEITEISNVPFEAPEVENSKTPEKTTENGSEVNPEMKKASKAEKSANVREPSLTSVDPNVVDTGSPQGNPQPQPQGDSKGGTGTAEFEAAPESPTPAPTSLVTEGSPQPKVSGAATTTPEVEVKATETEPKSPVVVVNDETQGSEAAESSTEQPAAAGGQFEDVIDTLEKQSEGEDVKGGQEHRLEIPEDKEDKTSLSGGEEEEEDTKDVPVAPFEDGPKVASSEPAPAEAPFSETVDPALEQPTGKTKGNRN